MRRMSEMKSEVPPWTLGWRLQRSLGHAHVSVEQMAHELGVSRSTISRWMNDRGTPPREIYVKRWAVVCGVPSDWLLGVGQFTWNGLSTPPPRLANAA